MPRVYRRAAARRDLIEHYVYLAEHADEPTADRFLERVKETFELLSTQREIGAPLTLRHPQLAGLRKWRVEDFEKFLIFYLPRHDGVSIVRVLYAAQDWWARLGIA
ncbi:MAG: type II toxin-antitoxin system RelE/ParE family toxin [Gammaproteobacteria bacterium]|nr:MAG: type II toxin-antitoxin system RelE/ParE family toxin [Gammaproteobacteria bacterium]TLZ35000.1 MAG: type II toxin-antitoxin system RelE/ParE family toxin [Gammaproteobacteria bacterium]